MIKVSDFSTKFFSLKQKELFDNILLLLILLLAFIVRFYAYSDFSLSNDELSALSRLRYENLHQVIEFGIKPDGHPAGVQLFLYFITQYFGNQPAVIRFPFVVFGTLSVYLIYFVAKNWFNKPTAFFSAAAIALLEFPVLYSQIARPYSSGLFTILLSVSLFVLAFEKKPEGKKAWILCFLFGISLSLNAYNHYFSALLAALLSITGFFFISKDQMLKYFLALLTAVILFLPHLPITLNILKIGGVGEWLGKPEPYWFLKHILYIFNNSYPVLILSFSAISLLWVRDKFKVEKNHHRWFVLSLFLLPFLIGYFYSVFVNPVLQNSVLLFSLPFFLMFIFSFISDNVKYKPVLVLFFLILFYKSYLTQHYYNQQHFDEFQETTEFMKAWEAELGSEEILFLENINNPWYLEYYSKKTFPFQLHSLRSDSDLFLLKNILSQSTKKYCIYFKTSVANDLVPSIIQSVYPECLFKKKYGDFSELYLFSARQGLVQNTNIYEFSNEDFFAKHPFESGKFRVNDEFSFVIQPELIANSTYLLELKLSCSAKTACGKSCIVLSVQDGNGLQTQWVSAPFIYFPSKDSVVNVCWNREFSLKKDDKLVKIYLLNPEKEELEIYSVNYKIK